MLELLEMAHMQLRELLPATASSSSTCCAHISQINSNKYCFSSFINVNPLHSMSADCCMPWHQGWGTMVAVGRQRLP